MALVVAVHVRHPSAANCAREKQGVGHAHVLSASSPKVNVGRRLNFKSYLKLSVGSFLHFLRHLETVQQLLFFPFKPLKLPLALLSSQFLLLHALLVVLECAQLSQMLLLVLFMHCLTFADVDLLLHLGCSLLLITTELSRHRSIFQFLVVMFLHQLLLHFDSTLSVCLHQNDSISNATNVSCGDADSSPETQHILVYTSITDDYD